MRTAAQSAPVEVTDTITEDKRQTTEMLPGFEPLKSWVGLFGPANLPDAILRRVNADVVKGITSTQGRAKVIEDDPELIARLMPKGYKARPEQAILFEVAAWDSNCPQHIPQRFEAAEVERSLAEKDQKIATQEAELAQLRKGRG